MQISERLYDYFHLNQNCEKVVFRLCEMCRIHVTRSYVKDLLEKHPDYPSMLAVSDVLKDVGVESIAVRIETDALINVKGPFIVQVSIDDQKYFSVASMVNSHSILFEHPLLKVGIALELSVFQEIFTGIVLLTEVKEGAGQNNYEQHRRNERRRMLVTLSGLAAIPALTILAVCFKLILEGWISILPIAYILLTMTGMTIGGLLIWYEIDQYSPALKQICTAGRKLNCDAVLHSKGSKIWGISWSAIGFSYFSGSLFCLLEALHGQSVLFYLFCLNIVAVPYIFYSLYYQWKVIKQWCPLCLSIQVVIALQFVVGMTGKFYSFSPPAGQWPYFLLEMAFSYLLPFLLVTVLPSVYRKAKEAKEYKAQLKKIKHDPRVFDSLLKKEGRILNPPDGLGIRIGNPDARYRLIKVCNPYCGPCARSHAIIEKLLKGNPNLEVQIIFTANGKEEDIKTKPVRHFLSIAKANDESLIQVLDDWYMEKIGLYSSLNERYRLFAQKYPLNERSESFIEEMSAMHAWFKEEGVSGTPAFFLNGHKLPDSYDLDDLQYVFSF